MIDPPSGDLARAISRLCGWLYFIAWSLSFYPQAILNARRRTTQGLTPDFPVLNVFGFSCYTISTVAFLYSPVVRTQYAARHPLSPEPTVRFNDLAFGVHAWAMCMVVYSQLWPRLWGWKTTADVQRHVGTTTRGLICGSFLGISIVIAMVLFSPGTGNSSDSRNWLWIDVIYAITYVKLLLTVFKYVPQIISNYQRQSTLGWSISQPLLDLSGGILSLLQLVIDSSLQSDWSGLTGNPVKFGLANISLTVNVIFIVQHYLLYGPVERKPAENSAAVNVLEGENEPLLPSN